MRIAIRQSGGYAGIELDLADLDTSRLPPVAARELEHLVETARFFTLPRHVGGEIGADFLQYQITVTDAGRTHTVAFDDDGSARAASLKAIVDRSLAAAGG